MNRRRGGGWSSIANVSLIEFAASSDHINPFSATHDNPARIIISNVAGEGAHQLLVNWTSIFDAEPRMGARRARALRRAQPLRAARAARPRPLGGADRRAGAGAAAAPAWWSTPAPAPRSTCSPPAGEFTGGLILPGIDLMRFVLHEHTGRLPLQEGRFVPRRATPSTPSRPAAATRRPAPWSACTARWAATAPAWCRAAAARR